MTPKPLTFEEALNRVVPRITIAERNALRDAKTREVAEAEARVWGEAHAIVAKHFDGEEDDAHHYSGIFTELEVNGLAAAKRARREGGT